MDANPVFRKALDDFKKDLTAQQCHDFSITTLHDVKNEVNKIQIRYGSAKKLRGMSRMSKFLEAMQQLEQVVSVFLNVSEFVAFIWVSAAAATSRMCIAVDRKESLTFAFSKGPIKFFLVVASSRLEILECLLDTFTDISEAIPDLEGYVTIFKDQPDVLQVLKRCYGDIIQFYHMAYGVLGRPGAFGIRDWRRIFDSFWKTFRTKFSPVLGSLRRHRELLAQVKSTATFGEIQKTRRALHETIEKSNEELKRILNDIQQKKKQILDKLGSQGVHTDQGHRRLPDQRHPTSGDWILENDLFLRWLDPSELSNDLLYLNGMPGAGKTTLVSRIIDSMSKDPAFQQKPLLNFYFEHGQNGKTLKTDMLRSFIEQLLQQDDAIVDDLQEAVLPARPSDLNSVAWLEEVATRTIQAQNRCYIIVDGVDECALDQRKSILQWLKNILSGSKTSNVMVKVLVSGQRDGVIDAMLQDCAYIIRLDDQTSHFRDIENFSSSVLTQIKEQFPDLEYEEGIIQRLDPLRLAEASEGMFMYAKVVLDNLISQTSIYELEQELEREYPRGLDEAYDRVAERVLEKAPESRKRAALQILGLISCAARPLKWREVQCFFCIDVINGSCDPRRRKVGGPKDLCSSFIDSEACASFPNVLSEAQLMMVHNTAKSYLLRSGRLDMIQQHKQMSLFCFQYLTRSAFDSTNQDSKAAEKFALTGFYGFFDYAVAHWDHHSLQYVRQVFSQTPVVLTEEDLERSLSTAWISFVEKFCDGHESLAGAVPENGIPLDTSIPPKSLPPGLVDTKSESFDIHGILNGWSSTQQSTKFEKMAVSLRQFMQRIDLSMLQDREKDVYLSLNGPYRPKCSRRACLHFNIGFESEADLSLHISWHEMAFKCTHTGCYAWLAGFPTSALLQTHLKRVHPTIDFEKDLFPVESRSRPRTLLAACRLGDIKWVQKSFIPMFTEADVRAANRALLTAAYQGHLAICVHLTQKGANPYEIQSNKELFGSPVVLINVIQMSIRLADLDLFSALRSAAHEHHKMAFIEAGDSILECILDALESDTPQFLVDVLTWNGLRAEPFTLGTILYRAGVRTHRQQFGLRKLSFTERPVHIESRSVREGLQTLKNRDLESHRKSGHHPQLCYKRVLVAPDDEGQSLLHRLCASGPGNAAVGAVEFLLNQLRTEDIQRHNWTGDPPLFTALRNDVRTEGASLSDQLDIIQAFFGNDLDGARNTRNAAGQGPLEFALTRTAFKTMPLVFKLCGADYSVLQPDDILEHQTGRDSGKMRIVFGLRCVAERLQVAVEFNLSQINRFICWLTDMYRESDTSKMLQSLMLHLPRETTRPGSVDGGPPSGDMLKSHNAKAVMVVLSLEKAEDLPECCRPRLEDLGRTQLQRLLPGTRRPK